MRPLMIHLDDKLHMRFKKYAVGERVSMSDLLRDFIRATVTRKCTRNDAEMLGKRACMEHEKTAETQ